MAAVQLIESASWVVLRGFNQDLSTIGKAMAFRPDKYWMSQAFQLWKATGGSRGWDGWFRPMTIRGNQAKVLRGHLKQVLEIAEREDILLDTTQLLVNPFAGTTIDDVDPRIVSGCEHALDDGQRECVVRWLRAGMGGHQVVVGGGKTLMFAAVYAAIKQRFPHARVLYFTPTERLVRQVFKEWKKWFPKLSISQYGGGEGDESGKDVVVATVAKIHANFDELSHEGWFRTFMVLAIDEQHHASADSWKQAILACDAAFFRFGASDTAKELDDVGRSKMIGLCGPPLGSIKADVLIRSGRLARPTINIIDVRAWENEYKHLDHAVQTGTPAWVLNPEGTWVKGTYVGPAMEIKDDVEVQAINQHSIEIKGKVEKVESRWCLLERLNDKAIIANSVRNQLLAKWAVHYAVQGHPTLVVATRTIHVMILEAVLRKQIDPDRVRTLWGQHTTKERDEALSWFASTPGSILVSPLLKEGVSIPEIRALVVADAVVSHEVLGQIIGRAIRRKPTGENTANVVISLDRHHPRLRRNGIKLLEALERQKGYVYRHPCANPEDKASVTWRA